MKRLRETFRYHDGASRVQGFTLLEVLVVIAVAALLISLLMPGLVGARKGAQDAVSLSNMRTHTTIFAAYASDWNDHFPYVTRPDVTHSVIRSCSGLALAPYFTAANLWPFALGQAYYEGRCEGEIFIHPGYRGDGLYNYNLSTSTMAEPAYWDLTTRTGPDQWAAQRVPKVQFAASKAILVEQHPDHDLPYQHRRVRMTGIGLATVDGSAARWSSDDLIPGVSSGEGVYEGVYLGQGVFGMHTMQGVLGRDIRR